MECHQNRQFSLVQNFVALECSTKYEFIIYVNLFERLPHIDELGQILRRRSYHFQWVAKSMRFESMDLYGNWVAMQIFGLKITQSTSRFTPRHAKEINCVELCIKFDKQTTEPQRKTSLWFCLHQHWVDKFVNDSIRCIWRLINHHGQPMDTAKCHKNWNFRN